mgnify:CR=1 FL=1
MSTLYLLHKPYRMLSQFTDKQARATLADVITVPGGLTTTRKACCYLAMTAN